MDTPLTLSIEGAIATITLNRPDTGNAIDLTMAQALLHAAIRCDTDCGGALRRPYRRGQAVLRGW